MHESVKEALLILCEEVTELKKEVEKLRLDLHEHKTNHHAKACWF